MPIKHKDACVPCQVGSTARALPAFELELDLVANSMQAHIRRTPHLEDDWLRRRSRTRSRARPAESPSGAGAPLGWCERNPAALRGRGGRRGGMIRTLAAACCHGVKGWRRVPQVLLTPLIYFIMKRDGSYKRRRCAGERHKTCLPILRVDYSHSRVYTQGLTD